MIVLKIGNEVLERIIIMYLQSLLFWLKKSFVKLFFQKHGFFNAVFFG